MPKAKQNNNLKRQIASLKREVNPIVKGRPCRGNPKPVNTNRTVYVSRTYALSRNATTNTVGLSKADIVLLASAGEDIRIDFIKIWNTTLGSGIKATLRTSRIIDSSTGPKDIQIEDYGTSASLSGVMFDIPMTLSADISEGTQTDNVVDVYATGASDKVLFHIGLRMAI